MHNRDTTAVRGIGTRLVAARRRLSRTTTSRRASAKSGALRSGAARRPASRRGWESLRPSRAARVSEDYPKESCSTQSVRGRPSSRLLRLCFSLPLSLPSPVVGSRRSLEGLAEDTCRRLVVQLLPANPRNRAPLTLIDDVSPSPTSRRASRVPPLGRYYYCSFFPRLPFFARVSVPIYESDSTW